MDTTVVTPAPRPANARGPRLNNSGFRQAPCRNDQCIGYYGIINNKLRIAICPASSDIAGKR